MSEMGRKIAERRKELGFTQEELAAKVGYKSKSTINKIELGINGVPFWTTPKFTWLNFWTSLKSPRREDLFRKR